MFRDLWIHFKMNYKCEDCDKIYKTKKSLQDHVRQVHPTKLHSCTFCGSSFKASIEIKLFWILLILTFDNVEKTTTGSTHYLSSYWRKILPM